MKIQIFTGMDTATGLPTFRYEHPFFAKAEKRPTMITVVDGRHVKQLIPGTTTVHVAKRTGRGLPCRDYSGTATEPAVQTRQLRRQRERSTQYAR